MQTKNINVDQQQLPKEETWVGEVKMALSDQLQLAAVEAATVRAVLAPQFFAPITPENVTTPYYVSSDGHFQETVGGVLGAGRLLAPAYRMPPALDAPTLPGCAGPADHTLHTHSNKFPIEREVILSGSDKNSKVPVLGEVRRRGKQAAIAPDAPPKQRAAWTQAHPHKRQSNDMQNQQSHPGTSTNPSFRHSYHDSAYTSYGMQNAIASGGVAPKNFQITDQNNSTKPPVPSKNFGPYRVTDSKLDANGINGNSQTITVTVETGKDPTKDAPKSNNAKAVTKTYHTLKDMISRFKGKESSDADKSNESEQGLNNVTEELRKSVRERVEPDPGTTTPRENGNRPKINDQNIYGRPMPQQRSVTEMQQYTQHLLQQMQNSNVSQNPYTSQHSQTPTHSQSQPQTPHQQMMSAQHQFMQQQMLLGQQQQHMLGHNISGPSASSTPQHNLMSARSQELLSRPQSQVLLADTPQRPLSQLVSHVVSPDVYYHPQYGNGPRSRVGGYQQDNSLHMANFTSLKQTPGGQIDSFRGRRDEVRSPQQLEREVVRQRGLNETRRTASQPQLQDDEPHNRRSPQPSTSKMAARRGSHGNLIESISERGSHGNLRETDKDHNSEHERESDDGGFRARLEAQGRSSFDSRIGVKHYAKRIERDSKMGDSVENVGQKTPDGIFHSTKVEATYNGPSQAATRHTTNKLDEQKTALQSKKINPGSAASSDYDKNGGVSSNVDSGRGSEAYSSGRRAALDTSADSDAPPAQAPELPPVPSISTEINVQGDVNWVDMVETELRQILEPGLHNLSLGPSACAAGTRSHASESVSVSSVTPPLPPLSPTASTPRNSTRYKHQTSFPTSSRPDYGERDRERESSRRAQRSPPPASVRGPSWPHTHSHKHRASSSKREHHASSSLYKKHSFGLDTTDMTSTTTRSLDLSSMLDGRSDSDVSTQDARAIRKQLQGLENMYCEVLKLLGVRKPPNAGGGKYQPSEPRSARRPRRYGSLSSLPSSSVSGRPLRDKRRSAATTDHRNKLHDMKSINKRFQRLESHVVTLARSVAHLSSEMRTQHLVVQEMENIRGEIAALRNTHRSQPHQRVSAVRGRGGDDDPLSFSNPARVKKLTKFFGDEPPLMRIFLKKLGYEKYASLLEAERVGAAELPYVGEDRLRALGLPLGPRLRILHEAGVPTVAGAAAGRDNVGDTTRDAAGNTTTTLCIV